MNKKVSLISKLSLLTVSLLAFLVGSLAAEVVIKRGTSGEPSTLDPHKITGTWESAIVGDLFLGLTTDAIDAAPIPGAATSWDISSDGKTYTFYLRDGALWSDGEPVTADDFCVFFPPYFSARFC